MRDFALGLCRHRFTRPAVFVLIGGILIVDMAQQARAWREFLVEQPRPAPNQPVSERANIDLEKLEGLFGVAVPPPSRLHKTTLPLTLLGSFVSAQGKHSVAVIQVAGKAPRRIFVGQEVTTGVALQAVSTDHVVLMRSGISEQLFFPRRMAVLQVDKTREYPSFNASQLRKLSVQPSSRVTAQKVEGLLRGLARPESTR